MVSWSGMSDFKDSFFSNIYTTNDHKNKPEPFDFRKDERTEV